MRPVRRKARAPWEPYAKRQDALGSGRRSIFVPPVRCGVSSTLGGG